VSAPLRQLGLQTSQLGTTDIFNPQTYICGQEKQISGRNR
jgi:hypothetical protein